MRVIILGAGPAGLAAAVRARDLGHQVLMVDPEGPGGNALRHSLVPSKTLIRATQALARAQRVGADWDSRLWNRVMGWQHTVVESGIGRATGQLDGVEIITGAAQWKTPRIIRLSDGSELSADALVVATGSRQRSLPGLRPDGRRLFLPRVFHDLTELPQELAIIGAGATGLESASLFARLGVRVHLYFPGSALLQARHPAIASRLTDVLLSQGVVLYRQHRISEISADPEGVVLHWCSPTGSGTRRHPHALLAAGREPVFDPQHLRSLGFELDGQGFFKVDAWGRTNLEGVLAIGDAASGPLVANRAWSHGWGIFDAEDTEPWGPLVQAIYTHPDIAWVGVRTEHGVTSEQNGAWLYESLLQEDEAPYGLIYTDADGVVVGGEAIAVGAAEAMSALGLAIAAKLTLKTLARFQPASPTATEWLAEAARQGSPLPPSRGGDR